MFAYIWLAFSQVSECIPPHIAAQWRTSMAVFIVWILINGILHNLINAQPHTHIDIAAHIGGLFGGFALGSVLARPVDAEAY